MGQVYGKALQRQPLITKMATASVLGGTGDVLAQKINSRHAQTPTSLDSKRSLRFALYGLLVSGPFGHFWLKLLDSTRLIKLGLGPAQNVKTSLKKMAVDQICMAPVMTAVFFCGMETIKSALDYRMPDSRTRGAIRRQIREKYGGTLIANYYVWPSVLTFAFLKVPLDYRVAFLSFFGLGWNAFLSLTFSKEKESITPC